MDAALAEHARDIDAAIREAKADPRPSMIGVRTIIGFGSPNKAGSAKAHGAPLGEDEVKLTKQNLGWPTLEPFFVPEEALAHMRGEVERGRQAQSAWKERWDSYAQAHPEAAEGLSGALELRLPDGWDADLPRFTPADKAPATRAASRPGAYGRRGARSSMPYPS